MRQLAPPEFAALYTQACEKPVEAMENDLLEIADDTDRDYRDLPKVPARRPPLTSIDRPPFSSFLGLLSLVRPAPCVGREAASRLPNTRARIEEGSPVGPPFTGKTRPPFSCVVLLPNRVVDF